MHDDESAAAGTFRLAAADLSAEADRQRRRRHELALESQPPPRKLAPYAAAIGATVREARLAGQAGGEPADIGWGSFVLLYDPAGQDGWDGPFRIIAYVRAELDPDIAADPLIGQVGWSWLTEALDARTVGYRQASGTVTRVVTEGFGTKHDEPVATGFELRASWSPAHPEPPRPANAALPEPPPPPELAGHLAAWCDALCAAAGLPPITPGVSPLRPRRRSP